MNPSAFSIPTNFLQLDRPIIFFDLETTGFDFEKDRIVELCAVKILPDGGQEDCYHIINPGISIPKEASAIHGIDNNKVIDAPFFSAVSNQLSVFFSDADLAGFNIYQFDIPFLLKEFSRCSLQPFTTETVKVVDVCTLFHKRFKRDLSSALKFYCGNEHTGAHSAKADVEATINVLKSQLACYTDILPNPASLHQYLFPASQVDVAGKFVKNQEDVICFGFGKHNGHPAASQPDYLKWMLDKDFSEDTKDVIRKVLKANG